MNKQQWKGKPLLEQEKTLSRTTLMLSAHGRPGRRGGEGVGVGGADRGETYVIHADTSITPRKQKLKLKGSVGSEVHPKLIGEMSTNERTNVQIKKKRSILIFYFKSLYHFKSLTGSRIISYSALLPCNIKK